MLERRGRRRSLVLPERFRGELLLPGDRGYEHHRWIVDRRFDAWPAIIARCAGVTDVRAALKLARDHGLEVAVRSGGHSFSGLSTVDDGIVIDLSLMRDVHVDLERRTARIRPGALGGDIVLETVPFGLAPAGGTRARVGFGGMAIFNGQGYLAPRYGNACDNILSVDVVLADGRWVHASPIANEDLFWAVRGAGDNFGIVTSFEVALHPVPEVAYIGKLDLDVDHAVATLGRLEAIDPLLSEDVLWEVRIELSPEGNAGIAIGFIHLGDAKARDRDLDLLRSAGKSTGESLAETTYLDLHYRGGFTGSRTYVAGCQLRSVDLATSELLVGLAHSLAQETPTPGAERSIDFYPISKGLAREPRPANAYGLRSGYGLTARVSYDEASQEPHHTRWADRAIGTLVDAGATIGGHNATALNHLSRWDDTSVRQSFGANFDRLVELKAKYDPENVFRRSVPLRA